jgi:hypothetical protein
VRGKAKKLQIFATTSSSSSSSGGSGSGGSGSGGAGEDPKEEPPPPPVLLGPREEAQLKKLKRGDALGIEALAQLFI